jgi:hypothetical protein
MSFLEKRLVFSGIEEKFAGIGATFFLFYSGWKGHNRGDYALSIAYRGNGVKMTKERTKRTILRALVSARRTVPVVYL